MNSRLKNTAERAPRSAIDKRAVRSAVAPQGESFRPNVRTKLVVGVVAAVAVAVLGVFLLPRSLLDTAHDVTSVEPPASSALSVPEVPVSNSTPVAQTGEIEPPGVAKPLKLFAVRTGSSSREGAAVLGASESSSRTYVVGAILENGATLSEVFDDHAVLRREGRSYKLYLPDRGSSSWLAAATSDLTVGDYAPPAPELVPRPFRVTDFLRTVPAYDGGSVVGFAAHPGIRREPFDDWGLLPGDVLISAGGYALTDATQMEAVIERLSTGAVLTADVIRAGRERHRITLDGSALVAAAAVSAQPIALPIR